MNKKEILDSPIICRDYETSGLNQFFDQPLTSCAKRYVGGEVVDQIYLSAKCESHRLPSPIALFVNGLSSCSLESGIPLNTLMDLDNKFNAMYPRDFILAYNARFDFGFSYSGAFQQLTNSNWYSWKTEHSVLCGLEILKAIYGFNLGSKIQFPLDLLNSPSFSLERVCHENGILYKAHNASEDVDATLAVFEMMKADSPEIVQHAMQYSQKKSVKNLINQNSFVCASIGFGENLHGRALAPILFCNNGLDLICLDVGQINPSQIKNIHSWEISRQLVRGKIDDIFVLLPLNKQKVIFGEEHYRVCYSHSELSLTEIRERANVARESKVLKELVSEAFKLFEITNRSSADSSLELSIFDDFVQPNESQFIHEFNAIDWPNRWDLLKSTDLLEPTNRIARLARRVIIENCPDSVPNPLLDAYRDFCNQRLFDLQSDRDQKWINFSRVLSELQELRERFPDQELRLKELEEYYDSRLAISP